MNFNQSYTRKMKNFRKYEKITIRWIALSTNRTTGPSQAETFLDHGGNRTRDLWFASPMLCQLSYEVKSARVCDISDLSLAAVEYLPSKAEVTFDYHNRDVKQFGPVNGSSLEM